MAGANLPALFRNEDLHTSHSNRKAPAKFSSKIFNTRKELQDAVQIYWSMRYDLVASSGDPDYTLKELLKIQRKEAIRRPEFSLNERSSSIIVMLDNQAFSFLFCSRHPCFCPF